MISSLTLSPLLPPSRQWSFSGKQFEHQRGGAPHSRRNAGTKRYCRLLHPHSPRSYADHYLFFFFFFAQITITTTQKPPCIKAGSAFVSTQQNPCRCVSSVSASPVPPSPSFPCIMQGSFVLLPCGSGMCPCKWMEAVLLCMLMHWPPLFDIKALRGVSLYILMGSYQFKSTFEVPFCGICVQIHGKYIG